MPLLSSDSDTICAVSTPRGLGGIGIVRISGPEAHRIARSLFRKKSGEKLKKIVSHKLYYGHIIHPDSGLHLEEVLLSLMRPPHTYTTEEMAEINAHGGGASVGEILGLCLQAGARLSLPGEFTKRAFLNGRIDLSQAEAVIDLIQARSEEALKLAVKQLDGSVGQAVRAIRKQIVELLALVELSIDFVEENLEIAPPGQTENSLKNIQEELERLISGFEQGKLLREGISIVLTGLPNSGKSSLLNALLQQDRAIVTHIPGTTTDVIHEFINLEGFPVKLSDTAGITRTDNLVEQEGIKRSRSASMEADLILLIIDSHTGITDHDFQLLKENSGKPVLVLLNKSDLASKVNLHEKVKLKEQKNVKGVLSISATRRDGLETLKQTMVDLFAGNSSGNLQEENTLISNLRHQQALKRAREAVQRVLTEKLLPHIDLLALELREALEAVGEITGENVSEKVLDHIFSNFCIGK